MFEKLLNANELSELKSMLRELNRLMEVCAMGDKDTCILANTQYNNILRWKTNKMDEKIKETSMENQNNLSFSGRPLTTGKFVQSQKQPTFFQVVNNMGDCNYSIPSAAQNRIPFEGQVKVVSNLVGAPPASEADSTIEEIMWMLAEFDVKQEEKGVSGVTVGKSWWKKVTEKVRIPSMEDIKRETKKALDPRHMAEQFKNVTKKTLTDLEKWGKEIIKNPAALLHPPMPKTGNKFIDKEILGKLETMAKKIDPLWQIGDFVEKHILDPSIEITKEIIDEMRGKKKDDKKDDVKKAGVKEVNNVINSILSDLRRKFEGVMLNNKFLTYEDQYGLKRKFDARISGIRKEYSREKDIEIAKRIAKRANATVKDYLDYRIKDSFAFKLFEEIVDKMLKTAGLGRLNWSSPGALTQLEQKATASSSQSKLFEELFSMIKNKKNTGIFQGSCGPDSKQIGTKAVDGKEYVVCRTIKPKPKIIYKKKYVRVHGRSSRRRVRGTVGWTLTETPRMFTLLLDFINKLKRVESPALAVNLVNLYKKALQNLKTNYGLFEDGCGLHSSQKGSYKIGDSNYDLCEVVPGIPKTKVKYRKVYTRGVGGTGLDIEDCPTCMIEELSLGGNDNLSNFSNFYKMAGIKHYSGNNMEGRQITRR